MKAGSEIVKNCDGALLIHQNFPDRRIDFHAHEEHQLFIPLAGGIEITFADAAPWVLSPGSMAYLPSGVVHGFENRSRHSGDFPGFTQVKGRWNRSYR